MTPDAPESYYELRLGTVKGGRYRVKEETAEVWFNGELFTMHSDGRRVTWADDLLRFPEADLKR